MKLRPTEVHFGCSRETIRVPQRCRSNATDTSRGTAIVVLDSFGRGSVHAQAIRYMTVLIVSIELLVYCTRVYFEYHLRRLQIPPCYSHLSHCLEVAHLRYFDPIVKGICEYQKVLVEFGNE